MRVIQTNVYQFNELSDEAKEHAREWYRDGGFDYEWYDSVYEWATEAGALMGITVDKIYFSGFYSQGDGACFEGSYQYAKGSTKAIRETYPKCIELQDNAYRLQRAQNNNFYGVMAYVKQRGHYMHEMCTEINVEHNYGTYVSDKTDDEFCDILRDFMRWIYKSLEAEFEYLNSDEQVEDTILANEYEFNAEGERV